MPKYQVTMICVSEKRAFMNIEADSEEKAIDAAEEIFINDLNDEEIDWIDSDIEGVSYEVDEVPGVRT